MQTLLFFPQCFLHRSLYPCTFLYTSNSPTYRFDQNTRLHIHLQAGLASVSWWVSHSQQLPSSFFCRALSHNLEFVHMMVTLSVFLCKLFGYKTAQTNSSTRLYRKLAQARPNYVKVLYPIQPLYTPCTTTAQLLHNNLALLWALLWIRDGRI